MNKLGGILNKTYLGHFLLKDIQKIAKSSLAQSKQPLAVSGEEKTLQ